ncbi:hypothetical protein V6N13_036740 [Hibiscus sabdariffa]
MAETFDSGIVNSRNSRKNRRLDDNPSDGGGDTLPVGLSRPSSYKDSLMKDAVEAIPDVDEAFEEDEIEIQEGDVTPERRPRRNARIHNVTSNIAPVPIQGSRFNPILASNMEDTLSEQQPRQPMAPLACKTGGKKHLVSTGKAP